MTDIPLPNITLDERSATVLGHLVVIQRDRKLTPIQKAGVQALYEKAVIILTAIEPDK